MAARDLIKAQQALAAAKKAQHEEMVAKARAERERAFAPVAAFIREMADAGALYKYGYDGETRPLQQCLKDRYPVTLRQDWAEFRYIRYDYHISVSSTWPTDEGLYPGQSGFVLKPPRGYHCTNDPDRYCQTAEALIEALAAAIQHAIIFPEEK